MNMSAMPRPMQRRIHSSKLAGGAAAVAAATLASTSPARQVTCGSRRAAAVAQPRATAAATDSRGLSVMPRGCAALVAAVTWSALSSAEMLFWKGYGTHLPLIRT